MIKNVNKFKKIEKNFVNNFGKYTSKKTYEVFRVKYEKSPNCEKSGESFEWKKIYKNINNKKLNPELRVNNYKILNNGLALDIKLKSLSGTCYLCNKRSESVVHIFTECEIIKEYFCLLKHRFFKNKIENIDKETIIYHKDLDFESSKLVSVFKLAIWKFRNAVKENSSSREFAIFGSILYSLKIIFL